MQITQGPWYANGENVQTVAMSVANHICKVEGLTQEEVLANAQAIASVPAMLDVLRKIVDLPVSQRGNNRGTAIIPMDILHQINEVFERATYQKTPYEIRVEQLEKEGCTTSDAQGIADYEEGRGVLDEMIADYLVKHAAAENQDTKAKVVVEVEGGVVSGVFSDVDFEYIVIDHDEQEDPDSETPDLLAFSDGTTVDEVMSAEVKPRPSSANSVEGKSTVLVSRWDAIRYTGGEAIGAWCKIKYFDDRATAEQYFSFGGQGEGVDDELEQDKFGIPDNDIYYFADGEDELKRMMEKPSDGCMNEFVIESYELRYQVTLKDIPSHEFEITDHRQSNGQLYVDIAAIGGNMDDILSATFEINGLTDDVQTQCMHLAFGSGDNAASFFKYNDAYRIRLEPGVSLEQVPSDQDGLVMFELK